MRERRVVWSVGLVLAACTSSRAPSPAARGAAHGPVRGISAPAARSCKPEAPVAVELVARASGGEVELTLTATALAATGALELELVVPPGVSGQDPLRAAFGATAAGNPRTLVASVRPGANAAEVVGVARVPVGGVTMSRDASVWLGTPPPRPATRLVRTSDGDVVEEVRP